MWAPSSWAQALQGALWWPPARGLEIWILVLVLPWDPQEIDTSLQIGALSQAYGIRPSEIELFHFYFLKSWL